MILEVEVDEMQIEQIRIFSVGEIKQKVSQFFKSYSIHDPQIKKRILARINNFMDQLDEKRLFSSNLNLDVLQGNIGNLSANGSTSNQHKSKCI